MMLRAAQVLMVLTVACGPGGRNSPDAPPVDAPRDAAGSGSVAATAMEVSPHDVNLELIVVALGMVIAAGPVRGARRRRDTL